MLIIPSPGAGGESTAGLNYWVGATLTYSVDGQDEVVPVNPDKITVKPEVPPGSTYVGGVPGAIAVEQSLNLLRM